MTHILGGKVGLRSEKVKTGFFVLVLDRVIDPLQ